MAGKLKFNLKGYRNVLVTIKSFYFSKKKKPKPLKMKLYFLFTSSIYVATNAWKVLTKNRIIYKNSINREESVFLNFVLVGVCRTGVVQNDPVWISISDLKHSAVSTAAAFSPSMVNHLTKIKNQPQITCGLWFLHTLCGNALVGV